MTETRLESLTIDRRLLLVAAFVATGLALVGGVALAGSGDEVVVGSASDVIESEANDTVEIDITASVPEDGDVGAYEFELIVAENDVAEITDVEPNGDPALGGNVTITDGDHADVDAAYDENALDPNEDGEVTLATVTVETNSRGETLVRTARSAVDDSQGNSYEDVNDADSAVLIVTEPLSDPIWESDLKGSIGESELIVDHGAVYSVAADDTSDEYVIEALETNDGSERWNVTNDEWTWVVGVDEYVVAAEDRESDSEITAYDPATGEEEWSYNAPGHFDWQDTTVNADENTVYAPSNESLTVLNATSGETEAEVTEFAPTAVVDDADTIYAVGENLSSSDAEGEVRAIDPDGTVLWNEPAPTENSYWDIEHGADETVLVWDEQGVERYNTTDGTTSFENDADGDVQIADVVAVDDGYLAIIEYPDDEMMELVHLSSDGAEIVMSHYIGANEFYDGETGLYLSGDELIRLDETYSPVWFEKGVEPRTIVEIEDSLVGVASDGHDTVVSINAETSQSTTVFETDEWITWTAADEDQVYLGLPSSITALEPPTIDTVTLSGTVSAANEADIAGDELTVRYDDGDRTSTDIDADGSYSVPVEANTTQSVFYESTPERNGIADLYQFEPVDIGADDTNADFTVPEGNVLNVSVTDESGAPVEDATVNVYDVRDKFGVGAAAQLTTEDGLFHHHSADEPGIEIAGDAGVWVLPPEDDDRFVDQNYWDEFTVNESMTKTVQLEETDSDLPPVTGDSPPQDLSDDGLYEDVTGSGSFTVADVQALFDNRDSDAVQDNAAAFNFSGNDDEKVTMSDVQELWEDLQG
ncbi:PQQ-binding-like beta-propeller repeat protein [Natronorubrum sp. A-ect3]|uniref:outer membrane protein assembly factor BamB family protein n=1 Tax=Natronorubrum sp. A-ect3 TaxID=3242698 RepID=UPI00359DB866